MTATISKPKLLLVEGKDEVAFIGRMLEILGIADVQIWDSEGKRKMNLALKSVPLLPGFDSVISVGVIRDADENAAGAFDSVRAGLAAAGLPVPQQVGVPTAVNGLAASVFVLPGDGAPGMLETLVWQSVQGHEVAREVDGFVGRCWEILPAEDEAEVVGDGPAGWRRPRNRDKALMQALLSTMVEVVPRVGTAAQKGYFDLGNATFEALCGYLRVL